LVAGSIPAGLTNE